MNEESQQGHDRENLGGTRTRGNAGGDQTFPQSSRMTIAHFQPPPFWKTAVPIWFHRLESGFRVKGILDDNDQYDLVVSSLDSSVLTHVSDLLAKPPLTNKYVTLKTRLIEAYVDSEDKQLHRLLKETVLGDRRPTHLLREMKELAGSKVSDDLLKSLWLQQMPANVRTVLAVPHSTMKLLWAAVVVVSLVDAIDKKGFAKKTGFDVLEKKQNVVNLLKYIGNFANLYLEVAEKVMSVCEQSLPDKPVELKLLRRKFSDAKQVLHNMGMKPIRQLLLEYKPAANEKISKKDFESWQRMNEYGYQLAKAGDLLSKSSTNELPLMHYNARESSKPLAEQKEDHEKAQVILAYLNVMISSVARAVDHLLIYLKEHSIIELKTEKGEKAIKTTKEILSRLLLNYQAFLRAYMMALHLMKSMEIKKGNLPVYEHLKNIGFPLSQLTAEMVFLATGEKESALMFDSLSEYKKKLEKVPDDDYPMDYY
ncbi:hypothetical protein GE061_017221 [Apolygus lucorum]|uniref:DUF7041 domain-containing protein n=1 Tax=Apolygus lucorum TaxID=248454 RepID=A0A8S9XAH8_APOLU|nr:hypothetical protein GE061_017221 [Apolygus lucorum]